MSSIRNSLSRFLSVPHKECFAKLYYTITYFYKSNTLIKSASMLSKKLPKKPVMTVVKEIKLQVVSKETIEIVQVTSAEVKNTSLPARNEFNSGYLKPKKHDPL